MFKRIDEIAKKNGRIVLKKTSSLNANRAVHVAAMTGAAGFGGSFLKFAGDTTLGQAIAVCSFVVFLFLVLTGYMCLSDHGVL
jgi:hypothetical protein